MSINFECAGCHRVVTEEAHIYDDLGSEPLRCTTCRAKRDKPGLALRWTWCVCSVLIFIGDTTLLDPTLPRAWRRFVLCTLPITWPIAFCALIAIAVVLTPIAGVFGAIEWFAKKWKE